MALPKLETATYELVLPSTSKKIKFRPWLVKEQKILMMAQESEDDAQIEQAFANIVSACTFGKIDPYETPLFDIEYIFLQLRSKSVGEKVKLLLTMPSDGETTVEHELDLSKVAVQMEEEHSNIVDVTDDIKRVSLEIPNEYGFILKKYGKSIETDKDKFYGFALWKVFNMTNCRTMDVVEFKKDL